LRERLRSISGGGLFCELGGTVVVCPVLNVALLVVRGIWFDFESESNEFTSISGVELEFGCGEGGDRVLLCAGGIWLPTSNERSGPRSMIGFEDIAGGGDPDDAVIGDDCPPPTSGEFVVAVDILGVLVVVIVARTGVLDTPMLGARQDGPGHRPSSKPKLRLMSSKGDAGLLEMIAGTNPEFCADGVGTCPPRRDKRGFKSTIGWLDNVRMATGVALVGSGAPPSSETRGPKSISGPVGRTDEIVGTG
jgi:hypothetical protein